MTDAPILICFDGSDEAQHAIGVAADLLGKRRAVVLDIGPVLTQAESYAALGPVVAGEAFEDLNLADTSERVAAGVAQAKAAGFDAEPRVKLDAPTWEGIIDVADELDVAVIVTGSRGLSGARSVLEGSVSRDVAEHAGRPVLIVPPAKS